jgi:hypothetical protein
LYKPDKENGVAKALSRQGPEADVTAISVTVPNWLMQVAQSYNTHIIVSALKRMSNRDASVYANLEQDGMAYKNGRTWLGANPDLARCTIVLWVGIPVHALNTRGFIKILPGRV